MSKPTEVEQLLTEDERRVSVFDHAAFRETIAPPAKVGDEIDELIAEIREAGKEDER